MDFVIGFLGTLFLMAFVFGPPIWILSQFGKHPSPPPRPMASDPDDYLGGMRARFERFEPYEPPEPYEPYETDSGSENGE